MNRILTEKKTESRFEAIFPVKLDNILGETININSSGASLDLEKAPSTEIVSLYIKLPNLTALDTLEIKTKIVKNEAKKDRFLCEVNFLEMNKDWLVNLQTAISQYKFLNKEFINLTKEIRHFLQNIKNKFTEFDKQNFSEEKQIDFINMNKEYVFTELDNHFQKIWEVAQNFDKQTYRVHQIYYQQMLYDFFGPDIEINWHIYRKPLGYPGDYLVMNYIYEFYKNKYLGNSTYEKLINHYTCNIPFSRSNIGRKEFLKKQIIVEMKKRKNKIKILSVGCGPARELIELLYENKIQGPIFFTCFDFEKKALEYVKNEIERVPKNKRNFLSIQYVNYNIIDIITDKTIERTINNQDLIYVAGVFDYLGYHFSARLVKQLYQFLNKDGTLIICNASKENLSHRAYYEMLGEWNMNYRSKEEMLKWTNNLKNTKEIRFEDNSDAPNYLFLIIRKA